MGQDGYLLSFSLGFMAQMMCNIENGVKLSLYVSIINLKVIVTFKP